MTIKYKTGWNISITKVEIERETDHSVWIKGNRSKKFSSWEQYHSSSEEAFKYLNDKYLNILNATKNRLENAEKDYGKVLELNH